MSTYTTDFGGTGGANLSTLGWAAALGSIVIDPSGFTASCRTTPARYLRPAQYTGRAHTFTSRFSNVLDNPVGSEQHFYTRYVDSNNWNRLEVIWTSNTVCTVRIVQMIAGTGTVLSGASQTGVNTAGSDDFYLNWTAAAGSGSSIDHTCTYQIGTGAVQTLFGGAVNQASPPAEGAAGWQFGIGAEQALAGTNGNRFNDASITATDLPLLTVAMSAPPAGPVNAAGKPVKFTVSNFVSNFTITPAVTNGTFSPAAVNVTANGEYASTPTVTAAGAQTISATNTGGATNPASATYVAGAGGYQTRAEPFPGGAGGPVGYRLLNADRTAYHGRTTYGVGEAVAGSDIYSAEVWVPAALTAEPAGFIVWDDATGAWGFEPLAAAAVDQGTFQATVQAGLTAQGYTAARGPHLDKLPLIDGRLPAALVGGRLDVSVGAYQAGFVPASAADVTAAAAASKLAAAGLDAVTVLTSGGKSVNARQALGLGLILMGSTDTNAKTQPLPTVNAPSGAGAVTYAVSGTSVTVTMTPPA